MLAGQRTSALAKTSTICWHTLARASATSSEAAKEMAKTDDNVKEFVEKCVKRHKPASTSEPSCSQPAASAEQGGKQADIESLLGKWMYATGSSFRSVEVPEFKDLIHALRPDFIIPTRKKMGGELLLNEYAATCDEVRACIDMAPYVSITCDAWSPSQGGEHILGWCVAWSGHAFMLDAVHTEDASVTALFMKEKLDLILDKHNLKGKVCALVTDTPSTMKALWALVQAAYPKTKASGCWMHVINLSFNGNLELGKGSWLLASLELGRGSWLLASLELGRGSWLLVWLLDPRYRGRHTELTHSQVMMADMCIAELASADGQGTDRAAGDARFNLHQRWLMPKALQLVGLSNSVLDTVLTANPCLWWQTYGHGFGVLRDVAMRLLSIPATSASTERVFSTFKHIWSDHRQSMLMGRMWMSSYIYFNRRALKGTRGQTRSSEEERAEFEEWLQHQPNGISE
ncbi:hypothetical protein QJQ45_011901 [Haematococcus lacustris]|nr:hypothetical protein QJQ45_011901 [Haematococcus lacustris]